MKEKISKFSKIFISVFSKLAIAGIIAFVLFSIGKSIWKNHETNKKIIALENEIIDIEKQNLLLQNLNLYYQTDNYKELQARIKLNMKKIGENVLILTDIKVSEEINPTPGAANKTSTEKIENPNYVKWYDYLSGR